jgi:hypothetical protein
MPQICYVCSTILTVERISRLTAYLFRNLRSSNKTAYSEFLNLTFQVYPYQGTPNFEGPFHSLQYEESLHRRQIF